MYGSIPGHQLLVGNSNIPEETPRLFDKKLRRMNLSQAELCPGNSAPYFRNVLVPARQVPTAINLWATNYFNRGAIGIMAETAASLNPTIYFRGSRALNKVDFKPNND